MHGDFIKKDKNGFNLYERHCHKCGRVEHAYKPYLNSQCKSCANSERSTTHGLSKHPLYSVWESMVGRCETKSAGSYKYYGGRGIKICGQWRNNPELFISWCIENGYKKGFEIDRINPNGDYKPENCRFISKSENCRRSGRKSKLTDSQVLQIRLRLNDGETGKSLAKEFGVSESNISAIKNRLTHTGIPTYAKGAN